MGEVVYIEEWCLKKFQEELNRRGMDYILELIDEEDDDEYTEQ